MRYVPINNISIFQLSAYTPKQIRALAGQISASHSNYIAQAQPSERAQHVTRELEFGIRDKIKNDESMESRCLRLFDPDFWFQNLTKISGRAQETIAVRNLVVGPLEPFCSNECFDSYLERQSIRSVRTLKDLQRKIEGAANTNYVITKAACQRAFVSGHLSVLITLGLDGRYHSSSPRYEGRTFDDGYRAIHKMYESILEHLSQYGRRGEDFYGIRCLEVHEDGCPHFHILLYINPNLLERLQQKLRALHYKQSQSMGRYYDIKADEILTVRYPENSDLYGQAISYLFKNSYSARPESHIEFTSSLRQKAVISLYGKRQYEKIGMNGVSTKIKEIAKRKSHKEIASNLNLSIKGKGRSESWLMLVNALISGGAEKYKLVKESRKNKYGESVARVVNVVYESIDPSTQVRNKASFPALMCNYSRYTERCCSPWTFYCIDQHSWSNIRAPPIFI